jgi:hypothetical protein
MRPQTYEVKEKSLSKKADQYPDQKDQLDNPLLLQSYLGTPIFSWLTLHVEPTSLKGSFSSNDISKAAGLLVKIDTALFDVSMSRNIITTPIQGRNGTVKEYVSDGDYQINIKGTLVSKNPNLYPELEVVNLVKLCKQPQEIGVVSPYLNSVFGIFHLVIQSYSFPMTEGYQNLQHFDLNCISDRSVELTINENLKSGRSNST